MKKIALYLTAFACLLALFGGWVFASETYYLVFVWPEHDYWKPEIQGAKDAGEWLGVDIKVTGSLDYTAEGVVKSIEYVIALGPDAIITSGAAAATPEGVLYVHNQAVESGIAVIITDADSPDSKRFCFIGADQEKLGRMAADALAEAVLRKTGEISGEVVIEYVPGGGNLELRANGFTKQVEEKYPDLEVIARINDEGQAQLGQTQLMQLIASHPNLVGIYGGHATAAIAIGAALVETGTVDRIAGVSMDATPPALQLLQEGTIDALVVQNVYNMGFWAVVAAYNAVHSSWLHNPDEDWDALGVAPTPVYIDPGCMVITQENIEGYLGGTE